MKIWRIASVLMLVAMLAGCGGEVAEPDGAAVQGPTVRDSAGVRIVENGAVVASEWRAAAEPVFTVGWDSGEPTFTWPQSGRTLPDGGALIGEFGDGAVYRLGPDGAVLGTWGRKGEGPGEYQALDAILVGGDSVLVSDGRLRRVTVLSQGGDVKTTHRLPGDFLHQVSSVLSDGRVLLVPGEAWSQVVETRLEWVFETQPILAADLQSGAADTLAELPHLRRWFGTRGASPGPVHVKGRAGGLADGFAWARADEPVVRWYDSSGRLEQVASWEEEPSLLSPEWRQRRAQALADAYLSRGVEEAFIAAALAELEEGLDRHDGPLPYWDEFHVDRRGNVWLAQLTMIGEPSRAWRVLARDGTLMGWVDLPEVVAILDITDDHILAVRHDELDVPAVVMLALIKP